MDGSRLFFVLSGFLIGGMLWRELQRDGTIQFPRFFARRAFRIWPLYYAMLLYYSVLHLFGITDIFARWSDLLLVSNYFPAGLGRGWSLSTEEHFYIAVPLLLIAVAPLLRDRATHRVRLAPFFVVFALIEVVVLLARYATLRALHIDDNVPPPPGSDFLLVTPFHTHLEGRLVGACIALFAALRPSWFDRKSPSAPAWLGAIGFLAAVLTAVAFRLAYHRLFGFLELGLVYGGLVWFALLDRSWITRRVMAWRAWYPISRLSYGIYLNHWWALPIANVWGIGVMRAVSDRPLVIFAGSLAIGAVVSTGFALLTFLLIERPGLAARDVFDLRRAGRPVSHAGVLLPPDARPFPGDQIVAQARVKT